jgi:hypothetical protein
MTDKPDRGFWPAPDLPVAGVDRVSQPGHYPFISPVMVDAEGGALGILTVTR